MHSAWWARYARSDSRHGAAGQRSGLLAWGCAVAGGGGSGSATNGGAVAGRAAEQTRIVKLLVEKVIVSPNDLEVRLRANGIERLVLELQPAGAAQPEEALA